MHRIMISGGTSYGASSSPQQRHGIKVLSDRLLSSRYCRGAEGKLCLFVAIGRTSKFAVWIYCLVWMVVLDMLKLAFQRLFSVRERSMAR